MNLENENNVIKKIINSERHIIVRLGWTEVRLCQTWATKDYSDDYIKELTNTPYEQHWLSSAGVFPIEEDQISDLMNEYTDITISLSDEPKELVTYAKSLSSDYFENVLFKDNQQIHSRALNVFAHNNSFQTAMQDKRLCVVTSFPESIKQQLEKLDSLFEDKRLVNLKPENIVFIKAPPHKFISNDKENPYSSWNVALADMKDQLTKVNSRYDILLTGCGAFSLPLNYHAYKYNKVAINMGGDLQLMFGIKGKRWVDDGYAFNENWIYPIDSEKPENRNKVENGAYW